MRYAPKPDLVESIKGEHGALVRLLGQYLSLATQMSLSLCDTVR